MPFLTKLKNHIPSLSVFQLSLLLSLWLGIGLNVSFYLKLKSLTPYVGLKSFFFILSAVIIVVAAYHLIMQLLLWRFTTRLFAVIFIFLGGMSSYFVSSLGIIITPDQIQNAMQTDTKESLDLLSWPLIQWFVLFVILPIAVVSSVQIKPTELKKQLLYKVIHICLSFALILGSLFVFYVDYAAIFREHRELKGMISPQNVIASTTSYYRKKSPRKDLPLVPYGTDAHLIRNASVSDKPKLMVLVVGETARAESFSLNGYAKNTNPQLSKYDVINFTNVSSCGTATAVSLPCMFSGMQRRNYDEKLASHREGLLDIAQRAGYKVTWIDNNSGCKRTCDRVEEYKIPEALRKKWCDADNECFDEILVDTLQYYLKNIDPEDRSSRLIVLHQMGSHGPAYYKRSTEKFQPFQPMCKSKAIQGCSQQELINVYDNSIVYTDHVLSQTIHTLQQLSNYQTAFWYWSDHGESTGEHGLYLHGAPYRIAPSQQTHIPMLMWFSPAWQQTHQAQQTCLAQSKHKEISHDYLFSTALSLLDIRTEAHHAEYDLLHSCPTQTPLIKAEAEPQAATAQMTG
ncbi:lipid A phosphoethanolamine transferase [Acinetobacter sp. NCu2D-2]|uniref:phosphoethanolamine transferase n=1 Tax=Acinetobacter sp. NCu2D-2 TaxID=1608473 RepID=UPI0007CDC781|nr:phosphoethanolamine--lipid A transferase [Acinetobacter sp. NCu2D-2]ANF82062.1 lipid A phosphoethanolamine transferase [Acinetobacter sp. NCu2D-2]